MPASLNERNLESALPGFRSASEFVSPNEEAKLLEMIESCRPQNYAGDDQGGLRAISFGWRYDLGQGSFSPCEAMPEGFTAVRDAAARFAGLPPESIVQCLFNRYEKGAEIPWHCDKSIWEHVIGISLGGPAVMHFRKETEEGYCYVEAPLAPRSIYCLTGEARHLFDHSIPPVAERRWSITFRTFSAAGERLRRATEGSDRG